MKLFPLFLVSTLTLASCSSKDGANNTPIPNNQSHSETTQTGSIERPDAPIPDESEDQYTLEEQLKTNARNLMKGTVSEQEFIEMFSHYLATSNEQVFTIEMASKLRSELISIFDNQFNLYFNLLNATLAETTKEIAIMEQNPLTGKDAVETLYSSLKIKANNSSTNLVEEYFIFDATLFIKNAFSGKTIIPEELIVSIYQKKILFSENPQETLKRYKPLNEILASDEKLFSVFSNILGKTQLSAKSDKKEIEIIKRSTLVAFKEKKIDFLKSKNEVVIFYKNASFFSAQQINAFEADDLDAKKNYLNMLDSVFSLNTLYLAQAASLRSLEVRDIAQIQDEFFRKTYSSLLRSLNQNSEKYLQYFSENCEKISSKELDFLLKSYLLSADFNHSCVSNLAQKIKNKDYSYVNDLINQSNSEMDQYQILAKNDLAEYFKKYTRTTLYNLVLNIASKYGHSKTEDFYYIYNASKTSLMTTLKLRNNEAIKETQNVINDHFSKQEKEIYFGAGIYKGNFTTDKSIYLHPLAVLIPEKRSSLEGNVKSLSGGRIDGNFINDDYTQVENAQMNKNISTGAIPRTDPILRKINGQETDRNVTCEQKGLGGPGGGPSTCHYPSHTMYLVTRSSYRGIAPGEAYVGERGTHASSINLILLSRGHIETTIYSLGTIGFKGNTGINSPLCDGSNKYKPYIAPANYQIRCRESMCNSDIAKYESYKIEWPSVAGKAGKGGTGGNGGIVTIKTSLLTNSSYPSLTLGGLGGIPGNQATCFYAGQGNLAGDAGKPGENGKTQLISL